MVWASIFTTSIFFYKAYSDCRYSHIADDVINYPPTYLRYSKQNVVATFLGVYTFTLLQHISQRFCNDTCIMLRQPTLSQRRSVTLSAIITYHHGNTNKNQWKLASLIHSQRPSQEGLREWRRHSDLSGCYFILPPRLSKIHEKQTFWK